MNLRVEAERLMAGEVPCRCYEDMERCVTCRSLTDAIEAFGVSARQDGLRQAEAIALEHVGFFGEGTLHPLHERERDVAKALAAAISAEAAKERKG